MITDSSKDLINSYELSYEKKEVTDISCKIVFTLSINPDSDFSK